MSRWGSFIRKDPGRYDKSDPREREKERKKQTEEDLKQNHQNKNQFSQPPSKAADPAISSQRAPDTNTRARADLQGQLGKIILTAGVTSSPGLSLLPAPAEGPKGGAQLRSALSLYSVFFLNSFNFGLLFGAGLLLRSAIYSGVSCACLVSPRIAWLRFCPALNTALVLLPPRVRT